MIAGLRDAARALGGEINGGQVLAPGPGHSARDRSLSVRLDPSAPDGFRVHSFAGDDFATCRDHVKGALGGALVQAARPAFYDLDKSRRALAIWDEARPWRGTLAEDYLRRRGVTPPADCVDLRFHPDCPMARERVPALIALARDICTNAPRAIQRTHLAGNGSKGRLRRMSLGELKGAAVKLSPDPAVERVLGVGEGVETTLALCTLPEFGEGAVWALLSTAGLTGFAPLAGVEALFVAVDHDPSGAGDRAARTLADRWAKAGRCVTLIRPTAAGRDLADLVKERAHG